MFYTSVYVFELRTAFLFTGRLYEKASLGYELSEGIC